MVLEGLASIRRGTGRIWVDARRARDSSWLGWPLLGLLLVITGQALPWFAIPMMGGRSAWSLPVVLAGVPSGSWASYGAILAVCLGLGLLSVIAWRGRPCAATATVGAGVLVVCLTFLVATGTADWPLLQQLEDQSAQQTAIFGQFGYGVPNQLPSLMLLVPVTGSWALVAGALRLGWLSATVGGLMLFGTAAPSLTGWARRARRRWHLVAALGLLLVVSAVGRGAVAAYLAGQGAAAASGGDYPSANGTLALARRLDPLLTSSTAYDLALGQVLMAVGHTGQPLALLADANARGAQGDIQGQVTALRQAAATDPGSLVIAQQLDRASQLLALTDEDARPLEALSDPTVADEYTRGRILYAAADYTAALACFRQVLTVTTDANVDSSAFTYIALSELKLGQADQARRDLLHAVSLDTQYNNTLARSLVAGLYIGTKTGAT
jgi:hypothetical protein